VEASKMGEADENHPPNDRKYVLRDIIDLYYAIQFIYTDMTYVYRYITIYGNPKKTPHGSTLGG